MKVLISEVYKNYKLQNLLYVWYFLRSATLRGLYNTLALLRDEVRFEKKYGIESARMKKSDSKEHYHYQGASYRVLFKIFDYLKKEYNDYFFCDIGCGKGRVLYLATRFGYKNVCGIELDEDLLKVAETNLQRAKAAELTIRLVHTNALAFNFPNEKSIYFLFNPFNEDVLKQVVDKILAQSSAQTIFVYMNPIHRAVFDQLDTLTPIHTIKTRFYTEAIIYERRLN